MKKTRLFVTTSLFAALILISTMFLNVKLPNGYANLGDCFIIVAAFLLGPKYGACAAAIGASLSDIFLGYALYAPATFVIKALMAFCCGLVFKKNRHSSGIVLASLLSELIMLIGYFLYEAVLYGFGGAFLSIPGNSIQGILNIIAAYALLIIFKKYLSNYVNTMK